MNEMTMNIQFGANSENEAVAKSFNPVNALQQLVMLEHIGHTTVFDDIMTVIWKWRRNMRFPDTGPCLIEPLHSL